MNKTRILIIDDEDNVRAAIRQLTELYCEDAEVAGEAPGVKSGIDAIEKLRPDVVLLDIDMKDGTGFDLLRHFPSPAFHVIFITAYQEYAVQAFRFSALDFLLKPLDPDLFSQALKKAQNLIEREKLNLKIDSFLYNIDTLSKGNKKVVLKTASNIHVVALQDILYCEADRSYTNFYLQDKSRIMVTNTLGDYEELFVPYSFLRVHQSYLINTNYIRRYEKGEGGKVILSDGTSLPVAIRKKEQLLQLLSRL